MKWEMFFLFLYAAFAMDLERKIEQSESRTWSMARAISTIDMIFSGNRNFGQRVQQNRKSQLFPNDQTEVSSKQSESLRLLSYGIDLPSIKERILFEMEGNEIHALPCDVARMVHLKALSVYGHNVELQSQCKINSKALIREPRKEKRFWQIREDHCWFCDCKILPEQLRVETCFFFKSAEFPSPCHAICGAGYQGYECSYYPVKKRMKNTPFQRKLLRVFETTPKFIDLNSDYLKNELKAEFIPKGFTKFLNADLAFWRDHNGHDWAIHRKWYGQPKDVQWEKHVVEILKRNVSVPTKNIEVLFAKNIIKERERYLVPVRVIDFIQKYTQCTSFEEAVRSYVPEVEFVESGGERLMRLKDRQHL